MLLEDIYFLTLSNNKNKYKNEQKSFIRAYKSR